jgi:WD40 repeat protein
VACGAHEGCVRLWDLKDGKSVARAALGGHKSIVYQAAFAPDGKVLATAGYDKTVRLWDLGQAEPLERARLPHPQSVYTVAFATDGKTLISGSFGSVHLWDLGEAKPAERTRLDAHEDIVWSVAFAPDGRKFATTGRDGRIIVWEATGKKRFEWRLPGTVYCVRFAPDGRHLATANANGTVYILRLPQ